MGVFLAVSLVPLSPLCVCAHIYTHLTHTLHTHTFTNIPHTFPLCHIGCSCLIRHHDHTHQLGRVQAHGYLHTVGSQPPQSMRSSCITQLVSYCASPSFWLPDRWSFPLRVCICKQYQIKTPNNAIHMHLGTLLQYYQIAWVNLYQN